eukprot:6106474-Pyramimonas_sp.AAC.1
MMRRAPQHTDDETRSSCASADDTEPVYFGNRGHPSSTTSSDDDESCSRPPPPPGKRVCSDETYDKSLAEIRALFAADDDR